MRRSEMCKNLMFLHTFCDGEHFSSKGAQNRNVFFLFWAPFSILHFPGISASLNTKCLKHMENKNPKRNKA